jgi:hypothetical protein
MSETNTNPHSIVEAVIAAGDLSKLTPDQRNTYYLTVCQSIGLNPMTRPFEYIVLNGKLTLYARKDATDQLRAIRSVSITRCDVSLSDPDYVIVTTEARDASGRTDIDVGVVSRKDMRGDLGNVIMKSVTKSKRRVTLSLCGLGMLDETEVETIPDAKPFTQQAAQVEAPKRDDSWKDEVITLGKRAVEAAKTATPEQAEVLSAAASMGREVLKKNGSSTADERAAAINALKQALGE